MNYLEQVNHYRQNVIEPLQGSYDELLSYGCAPRIAAATLRYISGVYGPEEDITQDAIARDYRTSCVTLRKRRTEIEDHAIEALRDAGELHYSRGVIEPLRGCYDELLSRGCGPRVAAATLRYISGIYGPEGDITQEAVALDYSTSRHTIRKWRREIEDRAIEALRDAGELHYSQPIGGETDA